MTLQIWNLLTRTVTDPTTIDEAIDQAVAAHNEDPDAHLGDDQALQSHRASEIIDHLAESVVNDKLSRTTRRYMAIVDPSSESDFDTIESAVAYCTDNGYGDIYIVAGTHYIGETLELDARISLYGAGQEETIISSNTGEFSYIVLKDDLATGTGFYVGQTISGITFGTSGNGVGFTNDGREAGIVFEDCYFKYPGEELSFVWNSPTYRKYFIRCSFEARTTTGIFWGYYCDFQQCFFKVTGNPSEFINGYHMNFTQCQFYQSSLAGDYNFFGTVEGAVRIFQCTIGGCKFDTAVFTNTTTTGPKIFDSNFFFLFVASRVKITGSNHRFVNNYCEHGTGFSPQVVSGSSKCVLIGNASTQAISDSGTSTVLSGNTTI